jgi:hypothetical protein
MKNKNGRLALNSIGAFVVFEIQLLCAITAVTTVASEPLQFILNI